MNNIYEPDKGISFSKAVEKAKHEILRSKSDMIDMSFNEIVVTIYYDSNINDICLIYDLKCKIRRLEEGYKD